jgi:hypothetical protein
MPSRLFSQRLARGLLCLLLIGILSPAVRADERILEFGSIVSIQPDASLEVTETIRVRAEGQSIRRGIYRDFPTTYRDLRGNTVIVPFKVRGILLDGRPVPFSVKPQANGKRVYIGDPDRYVQPGIHTYTLVYQTGRQVGFFKDHDELFWNVTGNGWRWPIDAA